jgi:hypothetical protein
MDNFPSSLLVERLIKVVMSSNVILLWVMLRHHKLGLQLFWYFGFWWSYYLHWWMDEMQGTFVCLGISLLYYD